MITLQRNVKLFKHQNRFRMETRTGSESIEIVWRYKSQCNFHVFSLTWVLVVRKVLIEGNTVHAAIRIIPRRTEGQMALIACYIYIYIYMVRDGRRRLKFWKYWTKILLLTNVISVYFGMCCLTECIQSLSELRRTESQIYRHTPF